VYRTVGGVLLVAAAVKGGAILLKKKSLAFVVKKLSQVTRGSRSMGLMGIGKGMKFPKTDLGALFGRGRKVNKVLMTKPKFKITRSRNKVRNRKVLKGQDKVTFSDKFDIKKITGVKINEIKKSLKVLERFNNKMNKTINPKKKTFQKSLNLFKKNKTNSNKGPDLSSLGGGNTIAFASEDPYLGTINSIKAYSELTV